MVKPPRNGTDVAQTRMVAVVVAAAAVLWVGFQWLGGQMGWPPKYILLADFGAAAAFIWGMVVALRIWRRRRG